MLQKSVEIDTVQTSFDQNFNVAPMQEIPVVLVEKNEHVLVSRQWGLVPSWATDPKTGYRMINARAETITEKPSFKKLVTNSRCLIPASGFYEWKKNEDGKMPNEKIPYYITVKNQSIFCFAGIWTTWEHEGKKIESCAIITTHPNSLMETIHNRMPVILEKDEQKKWLKTGDITLLQPYSAEEMTAYAVSPVVNSPKNNGKACVIPV